MMFFWLCQAAVRMVARSAPVRILHTDWTRVLEAQPVREHLKSLVDEHRRLSHELRREGEEETEAGKKRRKRGKRLEERRKHLEAVVESLKEMEEAEKHLEELEALNDEDLVQVLKEEQSLISSHIQSLREQVVQALVPRDPLDDSDVILEVVSGRTTGGDVCQQFTRQMFDLYRRYAEYRKWSFDLLNFSPAENGGLHHAAALVAGQKVFQGLKMEGGTHRVQTIPTVGLSSRMQRIHTGTMTVVVLPHNQQLDVSLDPKDLRIDTFRSRGPGGQSVNTTDSAVRVVHLPSGLSAECQQSRSQLQNRRSALRLLQVRLQQVMLGKEAELLGSSRRQQVGTRSQSERIRTYNFSQDRVTDHRIGRSCRDIKELMKGGESFHQLILDVLRHADAQALLDVARGNGQADQC